MQKPSKSFGDLHKWWFADGCHSKYGEGLYDSDLSQMPPMEHPARRKGIPRHENPQEDMDEKLGEETLADASISSTASAAQTWSTDAKGLIDKSSTEEIAGLDLGDLAGAEVTAEVNARLSKKMHRLAVEEALAKNQAAQEEVKEKAHAAKAAIWEAHKAKKTADKAVKEAQKVDAAAAKATEAAEAAQAQEEALTLMMDAAEELADRTAEELWEVKKEG
jgi:hypothetical protein